MHIRAISLSAVVVLSAISADAGPIAVTYDFTGTVALVTDNTNFKLNGTIPVGTGVTGRFTYEAGSLPGSSLSPQATAYDEPVSFSVNIGGGLLTWNAGPLTSLGSAVVVFDNDPIISDRFEVEGGQFPPTGLTLPAAAFTSSNFALLAELIFQDSTGAVFSSQDIPTSLDLSKFDGRELDLSGGQNFPGVGIVELGVITTTIDSLTFVPESTSVPEPASLMLLLCGAAPIAVALWRRRGVRGGCLSTAETH